MGVTAEKLARLGHFVTAIDASEKIIDAARALHPGPQYITTDFCHHHPVFDSPQAFDVIYFQESLHYFKDPVQVVTRAKRLLAKCGRLLVCDQVAYSEKIRAFSAVHIASDVDLALGLAGFAVIRHLKIGGQVLPTCRMIARLFEENVEALASTFSGISRDEIEHYTADWKKKLQRYNNGTLGYEIWAARPDAITLRPCQEQDGEKIVDLFNQIFSARRSIQHWRWKYLNNPFGGSCVVNAWDGDRLVAHYGGYKVPLGGAHMRSLFISQTR